MFSTERAALSPLYAGRIRRLHEDKMAINDTKIRLIGRGKMDFDDWGFVLYPEFTFTATSDREDGVICGYVPIGRALRKFFNEIPKYVNPNSALAGAWVGKITDWADIRMAPEDHAVELEPVWKEYDTRPGFGAMNHCAPDMNIGLQLG